MKKRVWVDMDKTDEEVECILFKLPDGTVVVVHSGSYAEEFARFLGYDVELWSEALGL